MRKWWKRILITLLALLLLTALTVWWLLRGSLPQLEGELALAGLSAPVSIQRDAIGVVTVDAANEADMARALGYVHAQERFFEMDLMRRTSAGELSELFGPIAVKLDKQHRVHRIRARVQADLGRFTGDQAEELRAYTDGVNAGLAALSVRPWAYLLLRQQPKQWTVADSALVGYAMYFDLQDSQNERELALWKLKPHLPAALFQLLTVDGSEWDAPLFGEARGNAVLPSADQVDLRTLPIPDSEKPAELTEPSAPGSNNWAVAGALTADGRAIVADDMHLGLRAPNIWFRARLRYADARAPGGKVDVAGFTLPGLPAIIVGSNTHVAWGFTNGYIDTADWQATPADSTRIREYREQIRVAGKPDETLVVRETEWGPILHERDGQLLALRWTAQQPGAVSFSFSKLAVAADLQQAFAVADHAGIPTQNLVVGDRSGRIAWRLIGTRPQRDGNCEPSTVADASCAAWSIRVDAAPTLLDPSNHRVWSANNRVLDAAELAAAGDAGYALGARAKQIRDGLLAKESFTEKDLLAIQLDDRALFLQRWWQLLQDESGNGSALGELASASKQWQGRASVDSVSYRIVRAWRLAINARIADGLTAPAQATMQKDFSMPELGQIEAVTWPLLQQRPAHLLPRRYPSWNALLEEAADEVRKDLAQSGPLSERVWGQRNSAKICHPLANALPALLKSRLCMPADPLPGDGAMPRVQGPSFGASERMVVSPGHEAEGIVHMPGGQSGHLLSPFWGAGHDAWVKGEPTPFLPSASKYSLQLKP